MGGGRGGGKRGEKHFSANVVNRAWPGRLQISTELSGPWQNANYCRPQPPSTAAPPYQRTLGGIFVDEKKSTCFFSQKKKSLEKRTRVAVVSASPANLIISIERMQPGKGRVGRWGGF